MDKENSLFEIVVGTYEKYLLGYYLKLYSEVRFNKLCVLSILKLFDYYMCVYIARVNLFSAVVDLYIFET